MLEAITAEIKSCIGRYGNAWSKESPGQHLYDHYFEEGHEGLKDVRVKVAVRPKNVSDFCSLMTFYG